MDRITKEHRSWNMSRIQAKNTKPELSVRRYLYGQGIRYRTHVALPGRPDIAIKKIQTAIFVNGCFWHGHNNCKDSGTPKTNSEFWRKKIETNKARDAANDALLASEGWDVITIWECELNSQLEELCVQLKARLNAVNRNGKTSNKV